jgi:hypothetical protein
MFLQHAGIFSLSFFVKEWMGSSGNMMFRLLHLDDDDDDVDFYYSTTLVTMRACHRKS